MRAAPSGLKALQEVMTSWGTETNPKSKSTVHSDAALPASANGWKIGPPPLKQIFRPLWFRMRIAITFFAARLPIHFANDQVFVLGCGRSGTTVIGECIGADADVLYLNEPYYLWYNVTPQTDFSGLIGKRGDCWLLPSDIEGKQLKRFEKIMSSLALIKRRKYIVEKTPINSLRVNWLLCLSPKARFVVVRRKWIEIVNSIMEISANHTYKVGFRNYHAWWGHDYLKVKSLLDRNPFDLASQTFRSFIEERLIAKDFSAVDINMAVFEVIASKVAIDRALTENNMTEDDYVEIEYGRFIKDPFAEINRVIKWLKRGEDPKLLPTAFSQVKLRVKSNQMSEHEVIGKIHSDLRNKMYYL